MSYTRFDNIPRAVAGVGHVITRQCDRAASSSRLLHRFAHSRYDVLGVRPGSAQELSEQSTLSGNDWSTVNDNVELPAPTLFELDGSSQSVMDQGSETRCLCGDCTSGLAVDDSDIHSEDYSSAPSLRADLARTVRKHRP